MDTPEEEMRKYQEKVPLLIQSLNEMFQKHNCYQREAIFFLGQALSAGIAALDTSQEDFDHILDCLKLDYPLNKAKFLRK